MGLAAVAAQAQTLNKEVVINRDIEPAERAVTRPASVSPDVYMAPVPKHSLSPWEYRRTGQLTRQLTVLDPAAYADTVARTPYRGYASVGYLPAFNLGLSAGYRFIDTANSRVGAWLQYNGQSYHVNGANFLNTRNGEGQRSLSRNTLTVGADASHKAGAGQIDAAVGLTYARVGQPMYAYRQVIKEDDSFTQSATGFNLRVGYGSQASKTSPWRLGAKIGYFGFGDRLDNMLALADAIENDLNYESKPARQFTFGFDGGVAWHRNDHTLGLDIDMSFQHVNMTGQFTAAKDDRLIDGGAGITRDPITLFVNNDSKTYGVTRFNPHYMFSRDVFTAVLGANIDIATSGHSGLYIAPNAHVAYTPTQQFSVWGTATGGKRLNRLDALFAECPYMPSELTYSQSSVIDGTVGADFGPYKGVTVSAWVGVSKAGDWLMPSTVGAVNNYMYRDLKGAHYGAEVAYANNWGRVAIKAQGATNGTDKEYYLWRDGARYDVTASLTVKPTDALDITLDWNWRSGRHYSVYTPTALRVGDGSIPVWDIERIGMGRISDLGLSAAYRLTGQFTITANLSNLMCRRWYVAPGVESARLNGLVGVAYKF